MGNDLTFNIIAATERAVPPVDKLADSIDKLAIKIEELDHAKAEPKVEVKTDEANAKLDDVNKKIQAIQVSQAGLIGTGITLGVGPIVAAGLAVIPAAFVAIGAAAEKSQPQVVASFGAMTNAAKQTAQLGFAPLIPSLVGFANQAQSSLGSVQGDLQKASVAAAPMLDVVGHDFLQATQQGIGASVPIIERLGPVAQAIGGDLLTAEKGAMGFLSALDPQPAADGLTQLGADVQNLLPPLGRLVNDAVPLGNDLLNLVGPALTTTAQEAHLLAVPLQAVGSVVGALGPVVSFVVPPILATAGATKLLTGSWTDFGGAADKLLTPIRNYDAILPGIVNKLGVTTAAQNAATKADLDGALVKAQLAKQAAEANAVQAAFAAEEAGTAEAELAAIAATDELAAADAALTEAETAAAGAAEGLTFSLGPIGAVLGLVAASAVTFGLSSRDASADVHDLSQQIIQLGQDSPTAAAGLVSGSKDLQQISGDLQTVGSSVQAFAQAYSGSTDKAQQFTDALKQQQRALGDQSTVIQQTVMDNQDQTTTTVDTSVSIAQLTGMVNDHRVALDDLTPAQRTAVQEYEAYGRVLPQAQNALDDLNAAQKAQQATLAQEGFWLAGATQMWNSYGNAVKQRVTDFNTATAGIKMVSDNVVAADSAFFQAQQNFQQLDQAVVQAQQGKDQAVAGVANANHSLQQAIQGVVQARQSEQQAIIGVQNAEQQVVKAHQGEQSALANLTQAQKDLVQARKDAAQQLADLQRQETDQGDTLAEAQKRLLDAQVAVKAAGLEGKSLADLGPLTTSNEAAFSVLLALQEAQHNLNNVMADGQKIADQNAAAQAAGVDGSQQVIAAQKQLSDAQNSVADAQQQSKQAAQSLQQAQQGVTQASQAVANAQWSEQQASAAVHQANIAEQNAKLALQQATDAASRSTDLNSAAGTRNWQTIEQLFEANFTATGDIGLATQATEAQGKQMGITQTAVDAVINSLTHMPATVPFAIVGTPSLNLTTLIQQASAQGISPFSLGLPSSQVQFAIDTLHGKATGGLISGPGTGRSDSIVAATDTGGLLRVSHGEYIVNATDTAKNLGLLEAINSGAVTGFASGGQVDAKSLMAINYRLAGWDGFLQGVSYALQGFGLPAPNLPPGNGAVDFGAFAAPAVSSSVVTGLQGSRASNRAIVMAIFSSMFGWGSPAEQAATDYLEMRESGYNNLAQNPTSTAFGLFQFLDSTWGGYGIAKTADPSQQTVAGGRYIEARYHDPIGAAAHEKAFNWFRDGGLVGVAAPRILDQGGSLPPGLTAVWNGTGRDERVRTATQEDALLTELRGLRHALGNQAAVTVQPPPGASVEQIADAVMRRLRLKGRS